MSTWHLDNGEADIDTGRAVLRDRAQAAEEAGYAHLEGVFGFDQ